MGYSDFRKGFEQHRSVNNGAIVSSTTVQKLQLALNKDNVTAAYILHFLASQAFSADPTNSDVRRALDSLVLEVVGGPAAGTRMSLDGFQLYDLARFTENQPAPVVSLPSSGTGGTAMASWSIDLHLIMDGARNDFMTAINTGLYDGVNLTLNFSTSANQLFVGGTQSAGASISVDVEARDYPIVPAQPNIAAIASAAQIAGSFSRTIAGAGDQTDVELNSGSNKTRLIMIHARDNSGVLSDSIVGDITLEVGNWLYKTNFTAIQANNVHKRGFDVTGVGVIDFGDDPLGWLPLENIKSAKIKWTGLAAGSAKFLQVRQQPLAAAI